MTHFRLAGAALFLRYNVGDAQKRDQEAAMHRKIEASIWLILGLFAAVLLAQTNIARSKTPAKTKQKPTTTQAQSQAAKPVPEPSASKVIMVLQTRDHRVSVHSSDGKELRYSVATIQGVALADGLSVADLKNRFPQLYEVIASKNPAWAGI